MQWYYAVNGQQQGPVEQETFVALAREGKLKPEDLVWNADMGSQWAKASTVPGLFEVSGSAPSDFPPSATEWSPDAKFKGQTSNRDLMAAARFALTGKWGLAIGGVLLYLLIQIAMAAIPHHLGDVINFVIGGALLAGWMLFFLTLSRRQPATVGMIFDGFKIFGTAFLANLLVALLVFAWMLPALAVGIGGAIVVAKSAIGGGAFPVGLLGVLIPLFVLAMIPAMIAQFRYSMTFFILNDVMGIGPLDAIRHSTQMMDGNKWKLFCLQCRFIGWALLCVLTFGLGFLWLVPYMMTSMGTFYDDLKKGQV